jgi:hypothetical protein
MSKSDAVTIMRHPHKDYDEEDVTVVEVLHKSYEGPHGTIETSRRRGALSLTSRASADTRPTSMSCRGRGHGSTACCPPSWITPVNAEPQLIPFATSCELCPFRNTTLSTWKPSFSRWKPPPLRVI